MYTQLINNCSKVPLQQMIVAKVDPATIVHTDGWQGYYGLVDVGGYQKHYKVIHKEAAFVKGRSHINGIEGFWGFIKTRWVRFSGMNKNIFYLHLKEREYRYNHSDMKWYDLLLPMLRHNPLNWS